MHVFAIVLFASSLIQPAETTGTVVGRVVVGTGGKPAGFANVIVIGTRRGAQADENGRFRIDIVPVGPQVLRILLIGHQPLTQAVEVLPGTGTPALELTLPGPPPPVEIGTRASVSPDALDATIRPAAKFHVGDKPTFVVRIHNHGQAPVLLVPAADASDGWKSPAIRIKIEGPEGGWHVRPTARCGNTNGVSFEDFIEVAAGVSFDPFVNGWIPTNLVYGTFQKAGRFKATFSYDTTNGDISSWVGGPCMDCRVSDAYREMLERVPAVRLVATTTFEVAP